MKTLRKKKRDGEKKERIKNNKEYIYGKRILVR